MKSYSAWWLAAWAMLLPASIVTAKEPPAPPPAGVSDEQLYQDAMQCKVRVEALAGIPAAPRERIARALQFWTEQERSTGAKLGKSEGEMLGDEVLFGFAEANRPDSYRFADLCVRAASIAQSSR